MLIDHGISEQVRCVITSNMENIMKTVSKVALALAGVAGLALSAESAHAQLVLNGTGSSAGRLFAGNSPAAICAAAPTPLLFVSSEGTPNRYEWQCTINGVANSRVRYSATNSSDGFEKQPNGAVGTAVYLNTAGCPAGVNVTILGKTVTRSVCPAGTPTQTLTVHWGASDVKASSLTQNAGGVNQDPPPSNHLTTTPTVIVPFAIVVGGGVRNGSGGNLVTMTDNEIRQIITGNVPSWTDLGYDTTSANKVITVCQRTGGSGTIAALDETLIRPGFWGAPTFPGIANPSSSNVVACVNNNPNSIGYLDSDSVNATNFPNGAYQVAINGQPVNAGALGTGVARLTALRCGRYPYWADWNFITRTSGVQGAPINAAAGTNAAITGLGTAMLNNNPLPDFWLSENDTFVFKNDDRGPHFWFTPTVNGANISAVCN